ncbi:MAG TPA: alanine racemase [Chthoniobacterales bacterium]|nr:alanine racemase [Chthoniobacterales bacterium]
MTANHRCWVEIDRAALRHNAKIARERIGKAEMLAVVKANAYGHGALGVAETLANEVQLFGVANLEEALALREKVQHPIITLSPTLPDERGTVIARGIIPTVSGFEEAAEFNNIAQQHPHLTPLPVGQESRAAAGEGKVSVNFKVDTGNGRMGVVESEAVNVFKRVTTLSNVKVHSVSTHMPVSNEDAEYTKDQLLRFGKIVDQLRATVPGDYKVHVLQSAGTLAFNQRPYEIVRAGIILYGISPLPEFQNLLKPAMIWKTRIGLIRDVPKGWSIAYGRTFITPKPMRVATLTAGYADGYPRHLSNVRAEMLVRGKRCPLLGRVTMDLMVIDVSNLPEAVVGDEVVLMGKQGDAEIPCVELSDKAGTITWDITTRIGQRVKRIFI